MSTKIAVVGAGVLGRITAWRLARAGAYVSLFDQADSSIAGSCSAAAAGMLAPLAEAHHAGPNIAQAGLAALNVWPRLIDELGQRPLFAHSGSWVIALPGEDEELVDYAAKLSITAPPHSWRILTTEQISTQEPTLNILNTKVIQLNGEGYIDTEHALALILSAAQQASVQCHWRQSVTQLQAHKIFFGTRALSFDWVIDTRGLGASGDHQDLRGVRGELIHVHAPELHLQRPVRILHPRYPLYIVPRPQNHYIIGATQLESASEASISVRSSLELLSAAYAFHPALRQAGVTRLIAQARPAFFDNQPRVRIKPGLIAANGLFRHGWLLAPVIAEAICALVLDQSVPACAQSFVEEWP